MMSLMTDSFICFLRSLSRAAVNDSSVNIYFFSFHFLQLYCILYISHLRNSTLKKKIGSSVLQWTDIHMWKYRCSGVVIIHLNRLLKWAGNNLSVQVHTDSKNTTFFAGPCWWQNMRIVLIMGISEVILEMGQTWLLYNSMENCCYW